METGSVKWFDATKGYGFLTVTGRKKDVFVHISALQKSGIADLTEGQTVSFEIADNGGKESAVNVNLS